MCLDVPLQIINRRHHSVGRCLIDHVASAGNAIELTVSDFSMEPLGLLIDVDEERAHCLVFTPSIYRAAMRAALFR